MSLRLTVIVFVLTLTRFRTPFALVFWMIWRPRLAGRKPGKQAGQRAQPVDDRTVLLWFLLGKLAHFLSAADGCLSAAGDQATAAHVVPPKTAECPLLAADASCAMRTSKVPGLRLRNQMAITCACARRTVWK